MRITAARKRTVALAARGIALHQLTLQKPQNSKFLRGQKTTNEIGRDPRGAVARQTFCYPMPLFAIGVAIVARLWDFRRR
jgi:hypothetical protein